MVLLVKPLNTVLGQFKFGFAFPETSTGYGYVNKAVDCFSPLAPFTHASMFLFVSAIIGLVYYKKHGWIGEGGTKRVFVKSVSMTMPSGIAVIIWKLPNKILELMLLPVINVPRSPTNGAIGAAISPSKIILGTTTASILGSEGEVMKKLMAITIPSTILIGAVLFVMTAL